MLRTHTCGELSKKNIGEKVQLSGWVHSKRNLGGLIFIDLRDRYGVIQLAFNPDKNKDLWTDLEKIKNEWVVKIDGEVVNRPESMINKKMITGEIEIAVTKLEILNQCNLLPFEINNEENLGEANEALRLKYRFIDLRREKLQKLLRTKDEFITYLREYFHENDFTEVQTPILANSSPEGARDFLIPSRLYPGKFYALPQAPQQFKQLLMVGGLDRYFQIAPCFRDEDTRIDRHYGEFYQLDMEMSFASQEDIFLIMEPIMIDIVKKFSTKKIIGLENDRFKKIPWRESLEKYGIDKPDLRFNLEIKPISDLVKDCEFSVFSEAIKTGGVVHALKIDGGAKFSRKEIDELTDIVKKKKAKGLAYIILTLEGEIKSPLSKFLDVKLINEIIKNVEAKNGDIIFFVADKWKVVCDSLGLVRLECAKKLNLIDNNLASFCWITDFPMYEYLEEENKIDFGHNPFSMPQGGLDALNSKDPLDILAYQYDLVLNGFEVSSGAVRNHNPEIMYKAFEIAGYSKESVDAKFGAMINAFSYGAPPHAGNAPGIDRLLMVLLDLNSIRDIYAFPKDGQGRDLLMDSPNSVNKNQLNDLNIDLKIKKTS